MYEIMIHRKRYNSFGDMKDEVRAKVSQDIIKQREEAKHDLRTVSYLLETTLFNSRRGHVILSAENYQYLLAYANWLVVLSDNADMCYFTDDEVYIKVSGEYIIDVESNRESDQTLGEELAKRMYDNPGRFERDRSADEKFFEKIKQAFARDTGVPLEVFLKLMFYLETGGNIGSELYHRANTLCFWKEDIIDDYCSVQNVSKKLAEKALQLLSINPKRLKTKNNKTDFYLPIGDKEKRCDKENVYLKEMRKITGNINKDFPLVCISTAKKYLLSIYPKYHSVMFPDSILNTEDKNIITDISYTNSIHKVYVCTMDQVENLKYGDIVVLYRTAETGRSAEYSAVATSICVVEDVKKQSEFDSFDDFYRYVSKYSVFDEDDLRYWYNKGGCKAIKMTYNGALKKRIVRHDLIGQIGLERNQYWGFFELTDEEFNLIAKKCEVDKILVQTN